MTDDDATTTEGVVRSYYAIPGAGAAGFDPDRLRAVLAPDLVFDGPIAAPGGDGPVSLRACRRGGRTLSGVGGPGRAAGPAGAGVEGAGVQSQLNVFVVDSGGLSFLAKRDQNAAALIRALVRDGAWPPMVPSIVLAESSA